MEFRSFCTGIQNSRSSHRSDRNAKSWDFSLWCAEFRYRNCFGTETVPHPPGGRWQTAGQACRPHVFVRGLSRNFTIPGRGPSVSGPKQTETGHDRSQLGFWGTETAGIRRRVRRQFRCRDSFGTETVSVPKLWRTLQCNDTGLQGIPCPLHETTQDFPPPLMLRRNVHQ